MRSDVIQKPALPTQTFRLLRSLLPPRHSVKVRTGSEREETDWHRITCIGRTAEVAQTYLNKGSKVFIEGHLRTRKWENKEGKTQYLTEIVADNLQLLDKKSDRPDQTKHSAPAEEPYTGNPEDIPF